MDKSIAIEKMRKLAQNIAKENNEIFTVAPETVDRSKEIDIGPLLELANASKKYSLEDNGEISRNL